MSLPRTFSALILTFALTPLWLAAQDGPEWRISPEKINIQVGENRRLQVLDESANELHGATWSVNHPDLAEIIENDGSVTLHPKRAGTVRVTVTLEGEVKSADITIWPGEGRLPEGTTHWSVHPLGREIRDLAAVPTADGVDIFSLEQNPSGTILRAFYNDGTQAWSWRVPEITWNIELLSADWTGGALISASLPDSYSLYAVGSDGKLRWRHTFKGVRKAYAYGPDHHLLHLLSQSPDGSFVALTGLDGVTGDQRFEIALPASHLIQTRLRKQGTTFVCASGSDSSSVPTTASELFVNNEGRAYVAFTQRAWILRASNCEPHTTIAPDRVEFSREEKIILWQVHPDGTYRSSVIEEFKGNSTLAEPMSVASPTGAIIPDGFDGLLLAVRWSHDRVFEAMNEPPDELVYRINRDGEVVYKTLMPKNDGPLHDDMVLGENEVGFATRGGVLVAFDVRTGKEQWRWDSNTPEISVYTAASDGGCVVKTPAGMVLVKNPTETKDLMEGHATLNWQGRWLHIQQ